MENKMDKLFEVHILNDAGIEKAKKIANAFESFYIDLIVLTSGKGRGEREFEIVKTKLEEASFYAKKTMAMQPENQK